MNKNKKKESTRKVLNTNPKVNIYKDVQMYFYITGLHKDSYYALNKNGTFSKLYLSCGETKEQDIKKRYGGKNTKDSIASVSNENTIFMQNLHHYIKDSQKLKKGKTRTFDRDVYTEDEFFNYKNIKENKRHLVKDISLPVIKTKKETEKATGSSSEEMVDFSKTLNSIIKLKTKVEKEDIIERIKECFLEEGINKVNYEELMKIIKELLNPYIEILVEGYTNEDYSYRKELNLYKYQLEDILRITKGFLKNDFKFITFNADPRYGKTLTTLKMFDFIGYDVMVMSSYMGEVINSYGKELKQFIDFKNFITIDLTVEYDISKIEHLNKGNKVVILNSLTGKTSGKTIDKLWEGKYNNIKSIINKLGSKKTVKTFHVIDEADFGAHTKKSKEKLKGVNAILKNNHYKVLAISGTDVGKIENLIDLDLDENSFSEPDVRFCTIYNIKDRKWEQLY